MEHGWEERPETIKKRGSKAEKLICNYHKIVYNKDIAAAVRTAAGSHNNQEPFGRTSHEDSHNAADESNRKRGC